MVFSSTIFLFIFLPVTILVYYNPVFKSRRFKNVFLLLASLMFYAWGEPVNVLLMLACIFLGWFLGRKIGHCDDDRRRKVWLTLGITIYICIFFVFKYLTFTADQICLLLHREQTSIDIALPIGISFFLFQIMSYLFDVYYRKADALDDILNVGLYISLFPQLIAGPIVRYTDIEKQIEHREESLDAFSKGIIRFVFGLGKKVLLANYLGIIADQIFSMTDTVPVLTAWIGACAYTLQIYFDFSGYSDMAIGLGRMFGFSFPENFNYPYISRSVTEFWRRWHISLSTWFRDYIYIPMGGNRVKKSRWILNLFTVWLLTGIWHGANWTFILWGLIYFMILLGEKFIIKDLKKIPSVIGHIYTLLIVILAWVIFRSDSITGAFGYISNMFCSYGNGFCDRESLYYLDNAKWLFIVSAIMCTELPSKLAQYLRKKNAGIIVILFNFAVFVLAVINCISVTYNPFLYFNF